MREPSLAKITLTSALLHILIILLVAIQISPGHRELRPRTYFVDLVSPPELPHPKPKTAPAVKSIQKAATVRKAKPKPKVTKKVASKASYEYEKVSREIERLRAISVLSRIKELRKKKAESPKGVEVTGGGGDYSSLISRMIWQQWFYPDMGKSGLEVIISIRIAKDGRVISQRIERSSGDVLFDRSAMNAILKASPLPPPPKEMAIGVRFYL